MGQKPQNYQSAAVANTFWFFEPSKQRTSTIEALDLDSTVAGWAHNESYLDAQDPCHAIRCLNHGFDSNIYYFNSTPRTIFLSFYTV